VDAMSVRATSGPAATEAEAAAGIGAKTAARTGAGAESAVLDRGATALVLGIAAVAWFGWSQASPPAGWSRPSGVIAIAGLVAGALTAVAAAVRSRRRRGGTRSMSDPAVAKRYTRIVGAEAAACLAGVAGLDAAGRELYLSAWILLVVGVHFLPLARLFRIPALTWAGAAACAVAVAAAVTGAATAAATGAAAAGVAPSTVAGTGGGLVCLCCGLTCLRQMTGPAR
jgi:hypothetical protein